MTEDRVPIRRHTISQLETYDVTPHELQSIKRECGNFGLDFQVAQFCLTIAISFFIALQTTKVDSERTFDVFVILVVVGSILGVVFGIKWYFSRGALVVIFEQIETRQVGPVGDEDHPLNPPEVANLPAVSATMSIEHKESGEDASESPRTES